MAKEIYFTPDNPDGVEREVDVSALQANTETEKTAQEAVDAQLATDKVSGNAKMLGLGLSQDEATAMTGYKPPVEEAVAEPVAD